MCLREPGCLGLVSQLTRFGREAKKVAACHKGSLVCVHKPQLDVAVNKCVVLFVLQAWEPLAGMGSHTTIVAGMIMVIVTTAPTTVDQKVVQNVLRTGQVRSTSPPP